MIKPFSSRRSFAVSVLWWLVMIVVVVAIVALVLFLIRRARRTGSVLASRVSDRSGRRTSCVPMRGARGEPGHILDLIAHLERQPPFVIEPANPVDVSGIGAQALRKGETV